MHILVNGGRIETMPLKQIEKIVVYNENRNRALRYIYIFFFFVFGNMMKIVYIADRISNITWAGKFVLKL